MIASATAQVVITAILSFTGPSAPPENIAAFFTDSGPELCRINAKALNEIARGEGLDIHYQCGLEGVGK